MPDLMEHEQSSDYESRLLERLGIPSRADEDSHVIKPSAINAFTKSMHDTIGKLVVAERLKSYLRDAVANGFLNTSKLKHDRFNDDPSGFLTGGIDFFLPNTIGGLKVRTAMIVDYLSAAGKKYKSESLAGSPEASERAPTSQYLSQTYKGLFDAFNAALTEEGLAPLGLSSPHIADQPSSIKAADIIECEFDQLAIVKAKTGEAGFWAIRFSDAVNIEDCHGILKSAQPTEVILFDYDKEGKWAGKVEIVSEEVFQEEYDLFSSVVPIVSSSDYSQPKPPGSASALSKCGL